MKLIDLSGKQFGSYKVISRDPAETMSPYWICECICGRQSSVRSDVLRRGISTKCLFCMEKEKVANRAKRSDKQIED